MYKIIGISNNTKEVIDIADTIEEAEYLVSEYKLAFWKRMENLLCLKR